MIISNQHLQPLWTQGPKAAATWFQSGLSEGLHAALCLPPCAEAPLETGAHSFPQVLAQARLRDVLQLHLWRHKHHLILVLNQCLSLPGCFPLISAACATAQWLCLLWYHEDGTSNQDSLKLPKASHCPSLCHQLCNSQHVKNRLFWDSMLNKSLKLHL